jgi:hypothetical protein
MIHRKSILFILLALEMLLTGCGIWLLLHSSAEAKVTIPEGNPVIYEKLDYIMRGEFNHLYIYEDGSILYIEEKGLRLPSPGHSPTRTWKTGKFTQLDKSLLAFIRDSGLDKLGEYYQSPEKPIEGGGFAMGDMKLTLTVNYEDFQKTVSAFGYLTPDLGQTYPDMPSPLNDIYVRLRTIALATQEVYQENISP